MKPLLGQKIPDLLGQFRRTLSRIAAGFNVNLQLGLSATASGSKSDDLGLAAALDLSSNHLRRRRHRERGDMIRGRRIIALGQVSPISDSEPANSPGVVGGTIICSNALENLVCDSRVTRDVVTVGLFKIAVLLVNLFKLV